MNAFLASLLGAQAAPGMGMEGGSMVANAMEDENEPIVVRPFDPTAMPSQEDPPEEYSLDNSKDILLRDEALKRGAEVSDRKGMFGMKGTLRDVLGLVGDAFLVQGGGKALYRPTREQEKFSDAMAGSSRDATGAYERSMGINPEAANEFYNKYLESQAREQNNQLKAKEFGRDMTNDVIDRTGSARDQIARWLQAAGTDEQRAYVLSELAPKYLQGMGLTMEQLQLSNQLTPEQAAVVAGGDMRVAQQRQLPIAQQRADATTMNAESSRIRANRPPAGRAPRAETDREAAIRIGNKPEGERTEGERVFMKKYQGSGSILETFRSRQGAPATTGSRFRPAGQQ